MWNQFLLYHFSSPAWFNRRATEPIGIILLLLILFIGWALIRENF